MEIDKIIKERYSVRKYKSDRVSDEIVSKILEAAKHAPTAKNLQPFHVYVLRSEEAMNKINSVCKCIFGAPSCFVISYDDEQAWHSPFNEGYQSGEMDASIVADEMMLTAWSLGIGTCWVGWFDHNAVHDAIGMKEHEHAAIIMPFGYAADDSKPIAAFHDSFKEMTDIVTFM